ncbi:MAG: nucleotidyltransferase domain-containing protein [bacterium]|nr:nucleotidyltransferase domain-containing protein [bacterium]
MRSIVEKRSYGSVTVFWLDRAEALRRLREAAGKAITARPEVLAIHLFGSLAEGRAVPGSDADLLILLERSDRRWLDRPLDYSSYFEGLGLPVELLCYTVEEAEANPVARRAMERGLLLAERPD